MHPGTDTSEAKSALAIFGHVPGVGPSLSVDLWDLGLRSMADLAAGDPESMYEETCRQAGGHVDRCVLYVYRCAVAFARDEDLEPELRKWWKWKDRTIEDVFKSTGRT